MSINLTTSLGAKQLVEATDFHLGAFQCIADANQAGVLKTVPAISPNAGNALTRDLTGKLFVPSAAGGSFTAAGNSGPSQTISSGDTLSILGTGVLTTVASATDTVTASVVPGVNGDVLTTVAGVATWAAPAAGTFTLAGEFGTNQTISSGNTLTIETLGGAGSTALRTLGANTDKLQLDLRLISHDGSTGYNDGSSLIEQVSFGGFPSARVRVRTDNTIFGNGSPGAVFSVQPSSTLSNLLIIDGGDGRLRVPGLNFSVTSANTCASGGIGSTNMVRSAFWSGTAAAPVLNINSAAEHEVLSVALNYVSTAGAIPLVGGPQFIGIGPSPISTITAPACRAIRVFMRTLITGAQQTFTNYGATWDELYRYSVNAGPLTAFSSFPSIKEDNPTGTLKRQYVSQDSRTVDLGILAAGASMTVSVDGFLNVLAAGGGGSASLGAGCGFSLEGYTV